MKKAVRKGLVFGMMFVSASVWAQEETWQWRVTPYLWAMGVDGDVGIGNVVTPIDINFSDALEDLEFGGMIGVEASKDKLGLLLDTSYINLDDKKSTGLGTFRVELEQLIVQGAAVYQVVEDSSITLDLGLGGRLIDTDVDVNVPSDRADLSKSRGWGDPLLVARLRLQFAENCYGVLVGDVGGFGLESDLTWQVTAAAGYAITESVSVLLGYRYLDYDYDKDDFSYDAATSGLAVGLSIEL